MVDEGEALHWYIMNTVPRSKGLRLLYLLEHVERPLIPQVVFDLSSYTDANTELEFRFDVAGVRRLHAALRIPEVVITDERDRVAGIDALCLMLSRLAYPKRYYDLMQILGRTREALSCIFLHMIDYVYNKASETIYFAEALVRNRIQLYCDAIYAKGVLVDCIFGFPDVTKVAVCHPSPRLGKTGENPQKHCYSGHKRHHCLIYQAVTAPDGIFIHFWGPMEGRRHDSSVLRASGLLSYFRSNDDIFAGKFIYGDPAYGLQDYIMCGYKANVTDAAFKAFNTEMSRVRESVEWNFKCMKTLWSFIVFKNQQKVRLSPFGKFVKVAMLLTNCHNCYSGGNQISKYFGVAPPTMEEYLGVD